MAKFISKYTHYTATLRPGLSGDRTVGRADVPGIYLRFEGNIAVIESPEIVEMAKKHKGYGTDFILAEDADSKFAGKAKDLEPAHTVQEMNYGHVGPKLGASSLKEESLAKMREMATDIAKDMMKELLPGMAKEMAKQMFEEHLSKEAGKVGEKGPEIKTKSKKSEKVVEATVAQEGPKPEDDKETTSSK